MNGEKDAAHLQNVVLRRGQLLEFFLERQGIGKFNIQEKLGISWDSIEEILDDDILPISPPVKDRILNKATITKDDRKILAEVLGGRSSITITKETEEKIFCEVVLPDKNGAGEKKQEKLQTKVTPDETLNKKALPGVSSDMRRKKVNDKNAVSDKESKLKEIFAKELSFVELVNEIMPICGTNGANISEAIGKNKSYWSVFKYSTGPGKASCYLNDEMAEKMAKVFGLSEVHAIKFLHSHAMYVESCARKTGAKKDKKIKKTVKARLSKRGRGKNAQVSCNKLGITAEMVILYIVERLCLTDGQKFGDICRKAGIDDIRNINGNAIQAIVEFIKTLGDKNQEPISFLSRLLKLLFDEPIVFKVVGDEVDSIEKALKTIAQA